MIIWNMQEQNVRAYASDAERKAAVVKRIEEKVKEGEHLSTVIVASSMVEHRILKSLGFTFTPKVQLAEGQEPSRVYTLRHKDYIAPVDKREWIAGDEHKYAVGEEVKLKEDRLNQWQHGDQLGTNVGKVKTTDLQDWVVVEWDGKEQAYPVDGLLVLAEA